MKSQAQLRTRPIGRKNSGGLKKIQHLPVFGLCLLKSLMSTLAGLPSPSALTTDAAGLTRIRGSDLDPVLGTDTDLGAALAGVPPAVPDGDGAGVLAVQPIFSTALKFYYFIAARIL